nr:putative uncharacterized protein FLJ40606 [Saimiri boliviensis boliviensis]
MAAATEPGQATAPSRKRRRGRRRSASDPQTLARLAAGPWLPGTLTCPERTRGDAATRSARPPVLPPPPRPPQRRCRHLVSRAGTPRCACAGTASEGPRHGLAAILSVAGSAVFSHPACFRPPPLPPIRPVPAVPWDTEEGESFVGLRVD